MGPLFPTSRGGPLRRLCEGILITVLIVAYLTSQGGTRVTRSRYGRYVAAITIFLVLFSILFWLFPPTT